MAKTSLNLDRQADARVFAFGTAVTSGEALVTINKGALPVTTVVVDVKGSQTIAGDLNLIGNLNITGNVNTQTVTNTNIADITITLNDGGTTSSAANSGLLIEGDINTVIGRLLYDGSLTSKWKVGDGTTQLEVVTVSGVQTLTNKSITGSQITSAVANATLAASVTTNANLTGVITSVGNTTSIASQTGTGTTFVVQNSPTLTTPNIGVATGTSLTTSGAQTVGTSASIDGNMVWLNATNAFTQTFRGSNPGANIVYVLPTTAPVAGQVLSSTAPAAGVATMSWASVGTGSVTSVSVVTANGISGSVATATSTPAITLTLGAITPTTIVASGTISGSSFSGAGTGLTGTASGLTAGTVTTNANLTGDVTSSGNVTTLAKYFRAAVLSGTQDGVNKIFTIGAALMAGSEQIFSNGALQSLGSTNDYLISGTTITFQAAFPAPVSTDTLRAYGVW